MMRDTVICAAEQAEPEACSRMCSFFSRASTQEPSELCESSACSPRDWDCSEVCAVEEPSESCESWACSQRDGSEVCAVEVCPGNFGSLGHPHCWRRPCLSFRNGHCADGDNCSYCHYEYHDTGARLDKRQRAATAGLSSEQVSALDLRTRAPQSAQRTSKAAPEGDGAPAQSEAGENSSEAE
ncbi:MTPC1 [Symbiodinium microadriaticum]|nr:MTPC1 [Symbiodinium microadriaticum]